MYQLNDLGILEGIVKDCLSIFFSKYFVFLGGGGGGGGAGGGIPDSTQTNPNKQKTLIEYILLLVFLEK